MASFGKTMSGNNLPPWRVVVGLDRILAAHSTPEVFMADLLRALCGTPDIDAAWIGHPNEDGAIVADVAEGIDVSFLRDAEFIISVKLGPRGRGPAGRAWREGKAQLSEDVEADPTLIFWRQLWHQHGWRCAAAVPLADAQGVHHILVVYSRQADIFRITWPIELLTEFGLLIGGALQSRIHHRTLEHLRQLLDTLFTGTGALLGASSETKLLHNVCGQLTATGFFLAALIGMPDEAGVFHYTHADKDTTLRALGRLNHQRIDYAGPDQWLGVRAWQTGETQTKDDYLGRNSSAPWRRLARRYGWRSAMATPIRRNGKLWAILTVASKSALESQPEIRGLVEQLARLVTLVLDDLDLKAQLRAKHETERETARRDPLTLLPNRRAFEEFLPTALARADRHHRVVAVGVLDIDDFKPLNDQYGHEAGDYVLRVIANRMRATLRKTDHVARLGGDEFGLIAEDLELPCAADRFCARLLKVLAKPVSLPSGEKIVVTPTVGMTLYPSDSTEPNTLLRHADKTLYALKANKASRPRCWATFQEISPPPANPSPVRALFYDGGLKVHYQPFIDLHTGKVVGVEALARLQDGEKLMLPAQFLGDFSRKDREELFGAMLRDGLALLNTLAKAEPKFMLSVNIDAEVLLGDSAIPTLKAALRDSKVKPERIILELLENRDFPDLSLAIRRVEDLHACGVKLAIDDFGVQFATFQRARELRAYGIKLDQSLIHHLASEPKDTIVLSTLQTLCDWLDVRTCAEGAETLDVLEMLRILGVSAAQGFAIARPMPAEMVTSWLRDCAPVRLEKQPQTLLGAMALHTRFLRVSMFAPRGIDLLRYLADHGPMSLDSFIRQQGLTKTRLGEAYVVLKATLRPGKANSEAVLRAAFRVRDELASAIRTAPNLKQFFGGGGGGGGAKASLQST